MSAFAPSTAIRLGPARGNLHRACTRPTHRRRAAAPPHPPTAPHVPRSHPRMMAASGAPPEPEPEPEPEKPSPEDQARIDRMRSRLEGLFGQDDAATRVADDGVFDGAALRAAIEDRWGVQYDVQPQKRGDRVYVQIMWRYFEQQSFYMDEEEFASHCEAVAILLNRWNAVDYFRDYIASSKKRPVVGITINIPIPGVRASTEKF